MTVHLVHGLAKCGVIDYEKSVAEYHSRTTQMGMGFGLTMNQMDTHWQAPDHTKRLVLREIMAGPENEGSGGFYAPKKAPRAIPVAGQRGWRD